MTRQDMGVVTVGWKYRCTARHRHQQAIYTLFPTVMDISWPWQTPNGRHIIMPEYIVVV